MQAHTFNKIQTAPTTEAHHATLSTATGQRRKQSPESVVSQVFFHYHLTQNSHVPIVAVNKIKQTYPVHTLARPVISDGAKTGASCTDFRARKFKDHRATIKSPSREDESRDTANRVFAERRVRRNCLLCFAGIEPDVRWCQRTGMSEAGKNYLACLKTNAPRSARISCENFACKYVLYCGLGGERA